MVLREEDWPKREEITGWWRNLYYEKLHYMPSLGEITV
jgi:hypothetical protein